VQGNQTVSRKGHEIVALVFPRRTSSSTLVVMSRRFCSLPILFFVRVNQVLVRLWARAMEAALCVVFVPLLRLMSDRESVSVVSTPGFGFRDFGHAPLNRTASVQRRVCELIRMIFVLLKERTESGFCAEDD
jgi:hypothetical protein